MAIGLEILELLKDEPRKSMVPAGEYWSDYLRGGTTQYGPYFVAN
jgi:hypothetical protein